MTHSGDTGLCRHFGDCGGCAMQDVDYAGQLQRKSAALAEFFGAYWPDAIHVMASPRLWHYRNKVDPTFTRMRYAEPPPPDFVRETALGFKRKGQWFCPLDIEECRIGPEGLDRLLPAVRGWMRARDLRAWDWRNGDGVLRALLVRDGKRTGERMVVLITHDGAVDMDSFVATVREAWPAMSIFRAYYRGRADASQMESTELVDGAPHITERLEVPDPDGARVLQFRISPQSFFQTNPAATELLYGRIRAWVREATPRHLYDLFGGAGGIAFACADLVESVASVESVPEASADGRHNAAANGIGNVTFITREVRAYLKEVLAAPYLPRDAAAVVDPPRAGLDPKTIKRLTALRPARLLYVSCNPKILARELPEFLEYYRLASLEAFDLFPHTPHVEVLAALEVK